MKDISLQLTIRGLDAATKAALVAKAKRQGVSLNRLALNTLETEVAQLGATANSRFEAFMDFFESHKPMTNEELQEFDDAIAWLDKADRLKQQKVEREASS